MKKTIRIVCLLLAMLLCLSMAACTSEEDKAFEAANALLEAGEYEEAIEAFQAIGRYQEIAGKIADAQKLLNEENAGFLFGEWFDLSGDYVFTFGHDGEGSIVLGETIAITYSCEGNVITITSPINFTLNVTEIDGVTHIVSQAYGYDLVREENYNVLRPMAVEITLDNWQEYFELQEVNEISVNEFGDISSVYPTIGIFLKEEYADRLADGYGAVDVTFELSYDEALFEVLGVEPDAFASEFLGEYEIRLTNDPYGWWDLESGCTQIVTIEDRRNYDWETELSPYYQKVAGYCSPSRGCSWGSDGIFYCGWTNVQVNRVQGTLMFYPE